MRTANEIKLAGLRREVAIGVRGLERGRFQTYDDANLVKLADDVCRKGRIRLNALRLKVAAKVQRKK